MGIRNYLIEGSSGTGKTSVATELERRGFHVVHGDRVLAYVGDPETGEALEGPPQVVDRIVWGYAHWIWPVEKVRAIAADTTHPITFFCGGSRNFDKFLDVFDEVFVLDIDIETLNRRLDGRPNEPVSRRTSARWFYDTIGGANTFPPVSESTQPERSRVLSTTSSPN